MFLNLKKVSDTLNQNYEAPITCQFNIFIEVICAVLLKDNTIIKIYYFTQLIGDRYLMK